MDIKLCQDKIFQLIARYSIKGNIMDPIKNADNAMRIPNLIDSANKELASVKKMVKTLPLTLNQIPNQISGYQGYQLAQHYLTDIVYQAMGSKSYYFEVDNIGTITIEVNGTVQATITSASTGNFTAYKGLITSNSNDSVVIRFSGQYAYNVRNVALYAISFPTADLVQAFQSYMAFPLPADYKELKEIRIAKFGFDYSPLTDFYIENKIIYINVSQSGSVSLIYYKEPTTIDSTTVTSTILENEDDVNELIPYYVAGHLLLTSAETNGLGTQLINEYEEKRDKLTSSSRLDSGGVTIQNVWEGFA